MDSLKKGLKNFLYIFFFFFFFVFFLLHIYVPGFGCLSCMLQFLLPETFCWLLLMSLLSLDLIRIPMGTDAWRSCIPKKWEKVESFTWNRENLYVVLNLKMYPHNDGWYSDFWWVHLLPFLACLHLKFQVFIVRCTEQHKVRMGTEILGTRQCKQPGIT